MHGIHPRKCTSQVFKPPFSPMHEMDSLSSKRWTCAVAVHHIHECWEAGLKFDKIEAALASGVHYYTGPRLPRQIAVSQFGAQSGLLVGCHSPIKCPPPQASPGFRHSFKLKRLSVGDPTARVASHDRIPDRIGQSVGGNSTRCRKTSQA